jgi:hypothetical protein
MAKTSEAKVWTKPQLTRLGKLADVAPGPPGIGQGVNNLS